MTRSERVYRELLRVYPHSFRAQYEDEMVRLFLDQLGDAASTGRAAERAALWLRTVADIASSAPGEHVRKETSVAKRVDPGSVSLVVAPQGTGFTRLGYAIASLPFVLIVFGQLVAPGFMDPLFANPPEILGLPLGVVLLFAVAIWASLAFVVIRAFRSGWGIALGVLVFTVPAIVATIFLPATILIIQNLNV